MTGDLVKHRAVVARGDGSKPHHPRSPAQTTEAKEKYSDEIHQERLA